MLLLIPVFSLLIAFLTTLICLQLILFWFQTAATWPHMLLHMFQTSPNIWMSIISKTSWPSLIVLGMFNVVDSFFFYLSHFLRSNLVESLPVRFWNHKYHNRLFFKMVLPQLTNQIFLFFSKTQYFSFIQLDSHLLCCQSLISFIYLILVFLLYFLFPSRLGRFNATYEV